MTASGTLVPPAAAHPDWPRRRCQNSGAGSPAADQASTASSPACCSPAGWQRPCLPSPLSPSGILPPRSPSARRSPPPHAGGGTARSAPAASAWRCWRRRRCGWCPPDGNLPGRFPAPAPDWRQGIAVPWAGSAVRQGSDGHRAGHAPTRESRSPVPDCSSYGSGRIGYSPIAAPPG